MYNLLMLFLKHPVQSLSTRKLSSWVERGRGEGGGGVMKSDLTPASSLYTVSLPATSFSVEGWLTLPTIIKVKIVIHVQVHFEERCS